MIEPEPNVVESPLVVDNVEVAEYEVEALRRAASARGLDYDELDEREKLELAREVEPESEHSTHNVTTNELAEYRVSNLHPNENANESVEYLRLGDDSTAPVRGNTSLNNERVVTTVTDIVNRGRDLYTSTFLDSTEANGVDIIEIGLGTRAQVGDADHVLVNHALLDSTIQKTEQKTAVIDATVEFRDGGEL